MLWKIDEESYFHKIEMALTFNLNLLLRSKVNDHIPIACISLHVWLIVYEFYFFRKKYKVWRAITLSRMQCKNAGFHQSKVELHWNFHSGIVSCFLPLYLIISLKVKFTFYAQCIRINLYVNQSAFNIF
jgi:hypothetical protein